MVGAKVVGLGWLEEGAMRVMIRNRRRNFQTMRGFGGRGMMLFNGEWVYMCIDERMNS